MGGAQGAGHFPGGYVVNEPHPFRIAVTVLFPFACGYFLSYLLRAVNAVVAPDLVATFHLTAAELGLLTAAYLGAFCLFQLPLGVLLDRYGPRRVQTVMLSLAAAGCVLFAVSPGFFMLFLSRAVIGFGFAGGLMASFKASSMWVPAGRRSLANAMMMSFGGLGIVTATAPTEFIVDLVGWRATFLIFAGAILAGSIFIFTVVPERTSAGASTSLATQLNELLKILKLPLFWRIAPLLALTAGSQIAIQTLWAGPWFRDVMGLGRDDVAHHLLGVAVSFMIGILSVGIVADRLGKRRVSPITVMLGAHLVYFSAQSLIVARLPGLAMPAWMLSAATGQVAILAYPWLAEHVGNELAGRSNATINFAMFAAAFAVQYLIGVIIGFFPPTAAGYDPSSYSWAFGTFLVLQLMAFAWYLLAPYLGVRNLRYGQSGSR
jgi:predicted MFS family arabinose efflux permease